MNLSYLLCQLTLNIYIIIPIKISYINHNFLQDERKKICLLVLYKSSAIIYYFEKIFCWIDCLFYELLVRR